MYYKCYINFNIILIVNLKIQCKFAMTSSTQLAPFESPRVGTQQGY